MKVGNAEVTEGFLKALDDLIGISHALPGHDKTSWKDTQVFEMGTNWRDIAGAVPIPEGTLALAMMTGGSKAKIEADDAPEIPMDVVAAECALMYPGRIPNPFVSGARCELFWIQDGISRLGGQISENGVICYSDRAASNFVTWRAVLGNKFVEKFETERVGRLAEMFYFHSGNYFVKTASDRWVRLNKADAIDRAAAAGASKKLRKGKNVTEVIETLIYAQDHRHVDAAAPILFTQDEVVEYNDYRILNLSQKRVMAPGLSGDPSLFPTIYKFLLEGLDGEQDGIPAREFWIAWHKRLWVTSYLLDPQPGQCLILAGEASAGKTFWGKCILGAMMGGSVSAERFLLQRTDFLKEAANFAIWRCDDALSDGTYATKLKFAGKLKEIAANPTVTFHPKGVDAQEIPFKGRVIATCNTDAESLRILPNFDATFKDKVMVFRICPNYTPNFLATNAQNEQRALEEIPAFLKFLQDYEVHPGVVDKVNSRYGVKAFHHSELMAAASSEQWESTIAEVIDGVMASKRKELGTSREPLIWTCTEFLNEAKHTHGDVINQLGGIRTLGKLLHKVIDQGLSPYLTKSPTISHKSSQYHFNPWA